MLQVLLSHIVIELIFLLLQIFHLVKLLIMKYIIIWKTLLLSLKELVIVVGTL